MELEWMIRLERPDLPSLVLARLNDPLHDDQVIDRDVEGMRTQVRVTHPQPRGSLR